MYAGKLRELTYELIKWKGGNYYGWKIKNRCGCQDRGQDCSEALQQLWKQNRRCNVCLRIREKKHETLMLRTLIG